MTNKAADKIDASCELEQIQRDLALQNHANREKILSDGICIDCQELYELKKKQGAGFV